MLLPTEVLARLVAGEWNAQKDFIDFETMPATRLARVANDALPAARAEFARRIADYAGDDLLCYFADGPADLVKRQEAVWAPILAWAQQDLGLAFRRASGIAHVDQPSETLAAVETAALALSDFQLAGLAAAAQIFGSAILALALLRGRLTAEEAFAASQVDETFQAQAWGEDAEAVHRTQAMASEATMLGRWFAALA
jgi:chaperone required for assembly of F1-ATPase